MKRSIFPNITLACLVAAAPQPGCALFKAVAGAAAQVPHWLVDLVGQLLSGDDYQEQLDQQAKVYGDATVAEAVRRNLSSLVAPPPGPARISPMVAPPRGPDHLRADRAELWLRRKGQWRQSAPAAPPK